LGPLANPARTRRQLVGVSDPTMAGRMLGVLAERGSHHVLLVHGHDGLDELTTTTTSTVHELENGQVRTWVLDPRDLGLALAQPDELRGADPATNAAIARAVLGGETGAPRDVVLLNAGAALVAAGSAMAVAEGMAQAAKSIDSGNATSALERLVAVSNAAGDAAG
jgi:anthranilate phosphoribosyltransferase